jgi:UDP-N-acetyl-D-glucosamine dehydrogenase
LKVAVIGQGYVGLPIAIASAEAGFDVVGFDINSELVKRLNLGFSHIEDIPSSKVKEFRITGKYFASSSELDLSEVEVAVIAVPTPLDEKRKPDVSYLQKVATLLGKNLKSGALIINESTSYPGTLRGLIAPMVNEMGRDKIFDFAISPERVDPGNENWKILNTPRLYSGLTRSATDRTRNFYNAFCDNLVEVESPEVAELAKLFENTFRQVNIALVNEFSRITNALGISANDVIRAAATKPYGFLKFTPGLGVGGHCIPVDPSYLAYISKEKGVKPRFIELANEVNRNMPHYVISRILATHPKGIGGRKILICGMSYKSNISDIRESPSIELFKELKSMGADVFWHDELVSTIDGTSSTKLDPNVADITILAVKHDYMELFKIEKSAEYIFDCLGLIPSAESL